MSDIGDSPEVSLGHPEYSERLLQDSELDLLAEDIKQTAKLLFGPYLSSNFADCTITVEGEYEDEVTLRANYEEYEGGVIQLEITSSTDEIVGDGIESEIIETKEFTMYSNGLIEFNKKYGIKTKNGVFITLPDLWSQLGLQTAKYGDTLSYRKLQKSILQDEPLNTSHQNTLLYAISVLQDYEIIQSQQ